jgi:hypothetical protein
LAFLLGASFANPDHPASHGGGGRVSIEDKFNHLAEPNNAETFSAQPEAFFRIIDD